jgi:hypothetical protein
VSKLIPAVLLLSLAVAFPAFADPPVGPVDPETAEWYQGLKQPGSGVGCCSMSDCRKPQYRIIGDDYEIYVDDRTYGVDAPNAWVAVPRSRILDRTVNKVGALVACWRKAYGVMCLVREPEV